ncbi:MAG: hypothetical protein ACPGJS_15815 [Flammeovirgaceae bacterium]
MMVGIIACSFWACQLSNTNVDPTEDFFRIYDINAQLAYEARDIQLLSDGGYLIYGEAIVDSSQGNSLVYGVPYFLKVDQFGIYQWDTTLMAYRDNRDKNKRVDNSRRRLVYAGGLYYFTGYPQDTDDSRIRLLSFDAVNEIIKEVYIFDRMTDNIEALDLVANPEGGFYASVSKCFNLNGTADRVGVMFFDDAGNLQWEKDITDSYMCRRFLSTSQSAQPTEMYNDIGYLQTGAGAKYVYLKTAINEDVDDRIFNLVVLDAATGDSLFSNLFNDVRILFDGDGSDLHTGVPMLLYTDGDDSIRMATANFTTGGEEILYPTIEVATGEEEVIFNENEFSSNELELGTPILIEEASFASTNVLLYSGTTREGRIMVAAFGQSDGKLLSKKYFGYNSFYEVGGIIQTTDGGFALAGHTITGGRFNQLCLIKISQRRLGEIAD